MKGPPSVNFKVHGKRITFRAHRIAINAMTDEEKADRILKWLDQEIKAAWENRNRILPIFEGLSKPQILEVLKTRPRANCRWCGRPSCSLRF